MEAIKLLLRIPPELHGQATKLASAEYVSLNTLILKAMEEKIKKAKKKVV